MLLLSFRSAKLAQQTSLTNKICVNIFEFDFSVAFYAEFYTKTESYGVVGYIFVANCFDGW
ncbi:hypothetical protein VIAG107301_20180 [Vibrio agarivorans]